MKNLISRLFLFLNVLPWTKPIAIIYGTVGLVIFIGAWTTGVDIPPNATQFGIWFGGAVFALATGKSVYEGKRKRCESEEQHLEKSEGEPL